MPISDLTQIHFVAEGKKNGDQQSLKSCTIDIGATSDTAAFSGGNPIILGGRTATGARSCVHVLCGRSVATRRSIDVGIRACLTRFEICRGFHSFGRDSELYEQQSNCCTHYFLFHNCGRQELLGKRPGVRWDLCSLSSESAGSQRKWIERSVRREQS